MKEIEIIPSDEDLRELYETKKKLNLLAKDESFRDFVKKNKKPLKALFG